MSFDWSRVDDGDVEIYKELKRIAIEAGRADDLTKGYSPFYVAIHLGKTKELARLFEEAKDLDINQVEPNGAKPILFAVEANSLEAFKMLIDKGAEFEEVGALRYKKSKEGEEVYVKAPLLAFCCCFGRAKMVDFLLDNYRDRIDINQTHTHENRTALYASVSFGHADVAKKLLSCGADPRIPSSVLGIPVFPIEKAILRGDLDMFAILNSHSPEFTHERNPATGNSPMDLAYRLGKKYLINFIDKLDVKDLSMLEEVDLEDLDAEFAKLEGDKGIGVSKAVASRVASPELVRWS